MVAKIERKLSSEKLIKRGRGSGRVKRRTERTNEQTRRVFMSDCWLVKAVDCLLFVFIAV